MFHYNPFFTFTKQSKSLGVPTTTRGVLQFGGILATMRLGLDSQPLKVSLYMPYMTTRFVGWILDIMCGMLYEVDICW